jgi:hypothetical protein
MYMVNTRPDICYVANVLSQSMSQFETDSLDSSKACIEIYMRHSWIWPEICLQCELKFAGIYRYSLRKEYSGPEEHIWLLFYLGVFHDFLVQHETKLYGLEYRKSRIYSIECGSSRSSVASQASDRFI